MIWKDHFPTPKKSALDPTVQLKTTEADEYLVPTNYSDLECLWDMEPGTLEVGKRLGGGSFGDVYVASFKKSQNYKVAVKYIKYPDNASEEAMEKVNRDLDKEAELMKTLRHTNVVSFIG